MSSTQPSFAQGSFVQESCVRQSFIEHTQQIEPPPLPQEQLPTMYDLPSEDPEEPGLPDEFHDYQPELLRLTFQPPTYPPNRVFSGSDLNLYYDVRHPLWHKRPDWFGVVGVSRFYQERDLRLSYVIWQEKVRPFIVVELLSPGTEDEDFGRTTSEAEQPPTKWQVYEQILQVPYYLLFSRYTNELQAFVLQGGRYQQVALTENKLWIPDLAMGLGLWQGAYDKHRRVWLRWYNASGWIPTPEEQERQRAEQERQRAKQERQRAEQERQLTERERRRADRADRRAERLAEQLRALGIEPDEEE